MRTRSNRTSVLSFLERRIERADSVHGTVCARTSVGGAPLTDHVAHVAIVRRSTRIVALWRACAMKAQEPLQKASQGTAPAMISRGRIQAPLPDDVRRPGIRRRARGAARVADIATTRTKRGARRPKRARQAPSSKTELRPFDRMAGHARPLKKAKERHDAAPVRGASSSSAVPSQRRTWSR